MSNETPINIMLVDDVEANQIAMEALILSAEDELVSSCSIVKASSGNEALKLSLQTDCAVILLDVQMPGMDGFETALYLRKNQKTRQIPIIFVTAISKEDSHVFKGYESGAVDYLFKPVEPSILLSKLKVFVELHHQKNLIQKQMEELEEARKKLQVLAMYDALTEVYNRGTIMSAFTKELARCNREKKPMAVALLDIDHFKRINDTYGHPAGDAVLIETANRIKTGMRPYDLFGRYGGEEFLFVIPSVGRDKAIDIFERVRLSFSNVPFKINGDSLSVTVSVGIAIVKDNSSRETILQAVDQALYKAKNGGCNQINMASEDDFTH